MVANGMAAGGDGAEESGVLLGEASDDEEGGPGIVLIEEIEDLRGEFGMGAIIECEGDGISLRERADDGSPELTARHEDGVGP